MMTIIEVHQMKDADVKVRHHKEFSVLNIEQKSTIVSLFVSAGAADAIADILRREVTATFVAHPSVMTGSPGWDETRQCYRPATRGAA